MGLILLLLLFGVVGPITTCWTVKERFGLGSGAAGLTGTVGAVAGWATVGVTAGTACAGLGAVDVGKRGDRVFKTLRGLGFECRLSWITCGDVGFGDTLFAIDFLELVCFKL